MASSSGKPTAVHFTLIFAFIVAVLGVGFGFISRKDYTETKAKLDKAQEDARNLKIARDNQFEEIQTIKKLLGYGYDEVGVDPDKPNTVAWAIARDVRQYGGYGQNTPASQLPSVHQALLDLRAELDRLQSEYNQAAADLKDLHADFRALQTAFNNDLQQYKDDKDGAEKSLRDYQANVKERLDNKDATIDQLNQDIAQLNQEMAQMADQFAAQETALNQEIKNLTIRLEEVNDKLQEVQKVSFEVADGEIVTVDHANRLVWINVGKADNLSKRTTFSVYRKAHHGIGRGQEDITGAIEVTNVIGPHLAEARILDEDIYRPIGSGDPIYTPLWSPGRTEAVSIVGLIDIDGDGRYEGDRKVLHEAIAAAGATIDNEVDDMGNLHGDGIDVHTKFLVIAELPDPASVDPMSEEREIYTNILKQHEKLVSQARQQGVRRISLNDFLAYIGFTPSRRLWRPGEGTPYVLKQGARSTAIDDLVTERQSSGQVSGVYTRSKRLGQPSSTGQTSKTFGGRGGGSDY